MRKITLHLDEQVFGQVKAAAKAAHVSPKRWIADVIGSRVRTWPASVQALAGAWHDFPDIDEIRRNLVPDDPRETL